MVSFPRVLAVFSYIARYFDWRVQRFCWPKGTSLGCVESIYVKTTEVVRGSEELRRLLRRRWTNCEFGRFSYIKVCGRFSMHCMMRASAPSLNSVYRCYIFYLMQKSRVYVLWRGKPKKQQYRLGFKGITRQ